MEIETSIVRDDVYPYVITRSNRHKYENQTQQLHLNKFITKPLIYEENIKEGRCTHMCHPEEARERDKKDFSEHFESRLGRKNEMDHELAIKKFIRPNYEDSANRESMEYVRPIRTLIRTMDHLSEHVLDSRQTHKIIYDFYDDRTRAICGDITKQSCRHSLSALLIHERIFRFCILFDYLLCEDSSTEKYLLNKHLSDRLRSCIDIYNICRKKKISCPFEPEIQSYILLLSCDDTFEYCFRSAPLTDRVRESDEVKFVISVVEAYRNDDFPKFFQLFKEANILHACLMNKLLNNARSKALKILTYGFKKNPLHLTLEYLTSFLLFSNLEDTKVFCESRGVIFISNSEIRFDESRRNDDVLKEVKGNELINKKLYGIKLSDIVDADCNNIYNLWSKNEYYLNPPEPTATTTTTTKISTVKEQHPVEQKPTIQNKSEVVKAKFTPPQIPSITSTPIKQQPFLTPQSKAIPINRTFTQPSKPVFNPKLEITGYNNGIMKDREIETKKLASITLKQEQKKENAKVQQKPEEVKTEAIKPTIQPKPERTLDEQSKNLIADLLYTLDIKSTLDPLLDKWRKYSKIQVKRRKKLKKIEELKSFLPPGRIMNTKFSDENKILQQYLPSKVEQNTKHLFETQVNFNSILFGILSNKNPDTSLLYWKMVISTHQDIRSLDRFDEKENWLLMNFFSEDLYKNTDISPCVYYNVHNDAKSLYICHRYCTMDYFKELYDENNVHNYSSILGSNSIIFILDKPDQNIYSSEEEYWNSQFERLKYILDIITNNTQIPILIVSFLSYFDDISLNDINNTIYDRLNLVRYSDFIIKIGILKDISMSQSLNFTENLSWMIDSSFKQPNIIFISLTKVIEYHGAILLNNLEEEFNSSVELDDDINLLTIISTDTFINKLKSKISQIRNSFMDLYKDNTIKNWPAVEFTFREYIHLVNRDHVLPRWNDSKNIKKIQKFFDKINLRNYSLSPHDMSSIDVYLDKIQKDYYMEYFISILRTQISHIFEFKDQLSNEEFIKWMGRCYMLLNINVLYALVSLIPKKLKIVLPSEENIDSNIFEECITKYRNIEKCNVPFDLLQIYKMTEEDKSRDSIDSETVIEEEVILW